MWNYDDWKIGFNPITGKRSVTKAMFMSVATHCKRALFNMLYNPEDYSEPENDLTIQNAMKQLESVSWQYFGKKNVNIVEYKNFTKMVEETKKHILNYRKEKPFINGATFKGSDGCICRSTWIEVKSDKTLKLYSIHINTENGESKKLDMHLWDLAYQTHVINNSDENKKLKVSECVILYVDNEYRKPNRGQNAKKIFIEKDVTNIVNALVTGIPYNDEDNKIVYGNKSVKDILIEVYDVLDMQALSIEDMDKYEPNVCMSSDCLEPECPCFSHCKKLENCENSIIFNIGNLRKNKKFQLINQGYRNAEELLAAVEANYIKLNDKQVRQLEYVMGIKRFPYIEENAIKNWMEETFPIEARKLYFLDFETFMYAIPIWKDCAPYEKIPFQFSLHIYDRDTYELEHFEFLAKKGKDPREECAKLLCKYIPKGAISVAYNRGFEKSVLGQLANQFPEMEEHLLDIAKNIQDLMQPFQRHNYYKKEFQGKYSIKYVLPGLFPNDETLNYKNLIEIQNGMMAMDGYLKLQNAKGSETRETRKHMLSYCALDTFAMVKIFWYLEKLVQCNFDEQLVIEEMKFYDGYSAEMKGTLPNEISKKAKKTTAKKKKVVA